MNSLIPFAITIILLATLPAPANALAAVRGAMSSSLGGTGRAGLAELEGVFLNPAEVTLVPTHTLGTYYRDGYVDDGEHWHAYGIGAADPGPNVIFPGALHYFRLRDTGRSAQPADGELWHVAIGDMILPNLAIGLSGYRLHYKLRGRKAAVQWNGSLGLTWMVHKQLGLAYVLSNITNPGGDVPLGLREEREQGLGLFAEVFSIANVRFDITRREVNNVDRRMVYMGSFESMSGKFMVFRTGYKLDDEQNRRFLTAGLGLNGPRLKLNYAFEKNIEGGAGALHSVDLRLPF